MGNNPHAHDRASIFGCGHFIGNYFQVAGRRKINGKVDLYTLKIKDTSRLYTVDLDMLFITGNSSIVGSSEITETKH